MVDFKKGGYPFVLFLLLAILLRVFSFSPLVIDHDESTYLVIADALLQGKIYLQDVIDTKPIGIFGIYAAMLKLFGKTIWATRLMACIFIAATAFMLSRIQMKQLQNKTASIFTGVVYIFMVSLFSRWGISPNTEIYFNFFNCAAIFLLLYHNTWLSAISAGVFIGLAFHTKYVAAADAAALFCFLIIRSFQEKSVIKLIKEKLLYAAFGFLIVTLTVVYYFLQNNAWDAFTYYTFRVTGNYSSSTSLSDSLRFLADYFLRFLPVTVIIFLVARSNEFQKHASRLFLYFWLILDLLIIIIPGKYFEHYFIQLMPVSSLLAGMIFLTRYGQAFSHHIKLPLFKTSTALLIALILFFHHKSFVQKPELLKDITSFMQKEVKSNERIYTANANHILYFLLNKESPTPYIHSSLLWNDKHRKTLQLDGILEIDKIREKNPDYILWSLSDQNQEMQSRLFENYAVVREFNGKLVLYRRQF
ncbi:MAG: glycosyltransferase family 39 protein [Saprospiraceae bacterium]|nr:glycosyltransferase family 39 protein [Saprospiraceae bacterium]